MSKTTKEIIIEYNGNYNDSFCKKPNDLWFSQEEYADLSDLFEVLKLSHAELSEKIIKLHEEQQKKLNKGINDVLLYRVDLKIKDVLEQLQKEFDNKANNIMNNFDLDMSERKGAFITINELKSVFSHYRLVMDKASPLPKDNGEHPSKPNHIIIKGKDSLIVTEEISSKSIQHLGTGIAMKKVKK